MTHRPTLISLFAGAGGLDTGLERAGFETVVATDFDRDCIATLRASKDAAIAIPEMAGATYLGSARLIHAPIQDLRGSDLRPPGAPDSWRPDLLAGGPPCQPFSSAGKMRSIQDDRGRLFEHFVRLAGTLKPRLILFENVQGLVTARGPSGEPGEVLFLVKQAFEELGYGTTFALLNSADFGAPQRRTRCFMLASRSDPLPVFPEPTHAAERADTMFGSRLPWVTLREFLEGMPEPSDFEVTLPSPALAEQLAHIPNGSGIKSRGVREATRPGGHWGYKQGTWVADPDLPARTITAAATQDWIRDREGRLRRLTWRECAGLQGFPTGWCFQGTTASKYRQIGNAVPVIFGEVLGNGLRDAWEQARRRRAISAPLPERFAAAIRYTKREQLRNGPSRAAARLRRREGLETASIKGLGSDDLRLDLEEVASA